MARVSGKGLIRPAGVPVLVRRTDTGAKANLRAGSDPVVIAGLPSEIVLFLDGRQETYGLTFEGPDERVSQLQEARLGIIVGAYAPDRPRCGRVPPGSR